MLSILLRAHLGILKKENIYVSNMEKKRFFGVFHVMIDCHDIDLIPPRVYFHNDDDSIVPV